VCWIDLFQLADTIDERRKRFWILERLKNDFARCPYGKFAIDIHGLTDTLVSFRANAGRHHAQSRVMVFFAYVLC
jgi:hypothetical protein